ncbi:hypothetical protein [Rhodococcus sp. NPDC058521]|uniref:hypothetical protein n=1 Tax=Rhodococcus sp. NPDC058521 TaxID=3346536 RepID=UPI0036536A05
MKSVRIAAAMVLVLVIVGGGAAVVAQARDGDRGVAVVNADAGAVVDEVEVHAGDRIAESLGEQSSLDWHVVSAEEAAGGGYLAVVTIPEDFSDAVSSVWGPKPRKASLDVQMNVDDSTVGDSVNAAVAQEVGAEGISNLLTDIAANRSKFQQAGMLAGFLAAGTGAADSAARELAEGADALLPYLATARAGSVELLEVSDKVAAVVDETAGTADDVANRLTELGATLGDVTGNTERTKKALDDTLNVLRRTPLPPEILGNLEQVSADLGLLFENLDAVPDLLGDDVGPESNLGDLVRSAMAQVQAASAQLSDGARQLDEGIGPIADQAPEMVDQATTQMIDGFTKLKDLSSQLSTDLGSGAAAIPARSTAQQNISSDVLAAPVAVSTSTSSTELITAERLAIGFAVTTVVLAVALLVVTRNRRAAEDSAARLS